MHQKLCFGLFFLEQSVLEDDLLPCLLLVFFSCILPTFPKGKIISIYCLIQFSPARIFLSSAFSINKGNSYSKQKGMSYKNKKDGQGFVETKCKSLDEQ